MTTNREWLYSMQPDELTVWFDAEHEANNDLPHENDVSADAVDANDANAMQDSREKLEADIRAWRGEPLTVFTAINGWLDRQAVITRREVLTHPDERDEQIAELTAKLESEKKHREYAYKEANKFIEVSGKLGKNVMLLTTRVDELTAEREHYRELLSEAIRYAHEIVNLQP